MEVKAKLNSLRIAPRKVRIVANLVKGMSVDVAEKQFHFLLKKSATPMLKLLASAVANAKHNFNLDKENLYIKEILVNEGYKLKRWMPRAFGRAGLIRKRTSKIDLVLAELKDHAKDGVKVKSAADAKIAEERVENAADFAKEKEIKKDNKIKIEKVLGGKGASVKRKFFQRKSV